MDANAMSERDTWEFPVVGTSHIPGALDFCLRGTQGTLLKLEHEPDNHYDMHAIKVSVDDQHIGYVPSKGNSCSKCWSPVTSLDNWCPQCGAPYEDFVKGGMARRILERGMLSKDLVCFISRIDTNSVTAPVYATLMTR